MGIPAEPADTRIIDQRLGVTAQADGSNSGTISAYPEH